MTSTQHIGAAGEILVQYRLLKLGIDSARMTTDSGIDLVVYSPLREQAVTVQVKTQAAPSPSGGKGGLSVGFYFPDDLRAEILALALLSTDQVWLFTREEARELAQQHNARGNRQLYWYIEPRQPRSGAAPLHSGDVAQHLLERRTADLFGVPALVDAQDLS